MGKMHSFSIEGTHAPLYMTHFQYIFIFKKTPWISLTNKLDSSTQASLRADVLLRRMSSITGW